MNVETIKMESWKAREKARAYDRLAVDLTPEDEALRRGYTALARGAELIDLRAAFRATGVDERGRPRLCIAAADKRWGMFEYTQPRTGSGAFYSMDDDSTWDLW